MKNHEHYDTPEALLNAFNKRQCTKEYCDGCRYKESRNMPKRSECLARFAYEEYKPEIPDWLKPGAWVLVLNHTVIRKVKAIIPIKTSPEKFYLQFEGDCYTGDLTLETLLRDYTPVRPPELLN